MIALTRPRISLALPVAAVAAGLTYALTSGSLQILVLGLCVAGFGFAVAVNIASTRGHERMREVVTVVAIVGAVAVALLVGSWDPVGVVIVAIVATDSIGR